MKTAKNYETDQFLDMPLKQVSGLTGHVYRPGTLELWVIAHAKGQIWRKRQVFGHASQKSIGSYEPCKSP